MKGVAIAGGEFSPADREALGGAAQHVLYAGQGLDFTRIESSTSQALAQAFPTVDFRQYVLQLIAVMAFVDGTVDQRKLALVLECAAGLEIEDDYIRDLAETRTAKSIGCELTCHATM